MEKRHLRKADIQDFIIKCRRCDAIFQAYKDLKIHLHISHKEEGTKCNICDRLMFSREGMKKHMQPHQSDDNLKCEHCGVIFKSRTVLKIHLEDVDVEYAKKCDLRDKVMINKEGVETHSEKHNPPLPNQKSLSISQRFGKYKNKTM